VGSEGRPFSNCLQPGAPTQPNIQECEGSNGAKGRVPRRLRQGTDEEWKLSVPQPNGWGTQPASDAEESDYSREPNRRHADSSKDTY